MDYNGHTFGYDGENKQITYNGGSELGGTDYRYDGDGRRVKKVTGTAQATTIFVYDAMGQMVAEYDTAAPQGTGGTSYLTTDTLGTPRIITDSTGAVKARHDYMPFGEEIGLSGGRTATQGYVVDNINQKFTQKERDSETGLDYFLARYYSANQGRFTSPDPLLGSGRIANAQTWNRYAYVLGNPLKFCDPLGLFEYLPGTSADDIKRIDKAYKDLTSSRDKYKVGSKEYNAIDNSLRAIGAPGQKNNVFVGVDNRLNTPGVTNSSPEYDVNGKVNGSQSAVLLNLNRFGKDDKGNAQLAGALGHEGTHVADAQSEAARLTGKSMVEISGLAASGGIMSKAISEIHAYRVSAFIAAAITPSRLVNSMTNGYEIWNRGWSAADAVGQRELGIRGALESQTGSYKYKFESTNTISIAVPGLNNALDTASRWTVNGGAILQ